MKVRLSFLLIVCAWLIFLSSCSGGVNSKTSNNTSDQAVMKPTNEYNYLLMPSTWVKWTSDAETMAGEGPQKVPDDAEIMSKTGYMSPKIEGLTDGRRIQLSASFPVNEKEQDYPKLLSKLASDKMGFPGRIPSDRLIAYIKLPGLESLTDCVHDIFDLLIERGQSPTGKSNPITAAMGFLMMAHVDYKEDIFSWMGPEMGLVMYKAIDESNKEYLNTAFVMSIKDKDKASMNISNLVSVAQRLIARKGDSKVLTPETYKNFNVDTFEMPANFSSNLGIPDEIIPSSKGFKGGILYTDEYLFVSDLYGLKQLADIYDPGGALQDEATIAMFVDFDNLMKLSSRYQEPLINELKKTFEEKPEQLKKFDEYKQRFDSFKTSDNLGQARILIKFTEKDLQVKLELTKSLIDFINFVSSWITESMAFEEELYKTGAKSEQ